MLNSNVLRKQKSRKPKGLSDDYRNMFRIIYFSGSKFMFWAYHNHLLHLLLLGLEDYPVGLHQINKRNKYDKNRI